MTTLRHYSLGEPMPASPHSVVSCLPTMADVHGYERHEPRVLDALDSGYPRFVEHRYIRQLIAFYKNREQLCGRSAKLIWGRRATQDLLDYFGAGCVATRVEDQLFLLHVDEADTLQVKKLQKFVQHTGCGLSSRQAEDLLLQHGLLDSVHPEAVFEGNPQTYVEHELSDLVGCRPQDVLVCASGMNAFYAGFRAIQEAQSTRGRTKWLQLGWLYLDSGCVLKEFLDQEASLDYCYDATDADAIIDRIEACGDALACVVIECPTNPLVQVADLPRIARAVRNCGGILMVDPTIASVYNVDVLPYADVLVTSLTKYACCDGDVMLGALALNPQAPHYADLVLRSSSFYQPPYIRDLARLAEQMQRAPAVVACMDQNARQLADYLCTHAAVKKVHYAGYSEHFAEVAKSVGSGGAMLTLELYGTMEHFYDSLSVMKGPSFGTLFTLVSPFMYLAHYDLVTSAEGRDFLGSIGIDPDLIRISVGTEPIEAIIEVFESALSS